MMKIHYQNEKFAVVEKPVNLPVNKNSHMAKDADYLNKTAAEVFNCNIYNPHRLDSKTSGLIILCFDKETTEAFNAMFRDKKIIKTYHAIVKGDVPESGSIDKAVFDRKKRKKLRATTHYQLEQKIATGEKDKNDDDLFICRLEVKIETGRWHQIRQHLSSERFDIIGDIQHGDWDLNKQIKSRFDIDRMFLHASALEFDHPESGEHMRIESDLPEEFSQIMTVWAID